MGFLDKLFGRSKDAADKGVDVAGDAAEKGKDVASDAYEKSKDVAGDAVDKAKDVRGGGDKAEEVDEAAEQAPDPRT
jgi:hypothetical protein